MTADRCKETTTTTGTGNVTLLGAVTQFQAFGTAFSSYPATVSYAIVGQTGAEWEVGVGTLTDATTLERTTVQASSNAGAVVNLSAGTKDVFATLTAQDLADITTALAGKAATVHTHAISDTTGLQTALDGKASTSHTHAIVDTTGLQTALDGKAASSHSHAATDITSGTLPDAVFPATLPAASGVNLTALNATNLASGTVADARLSANVPLLNAANTFTAANTISTNGAASVSPVRLSGTWFTGGTGTTTFPALWIGPSGATAPTALSTAGTGLLLNAPSGFTGNFVQFSVNGATSVFTVTSAGNLSAARLVDNGGTMGMWSTTIRIGTACNFSFSSTTGYTGSTDCGLARNAAGVVEVNSGTNGTLRDLKARALISDERIRLKGYTVSGLSGISSPTVGDTAYVTDATAPTYLGALTGGGAVVCPVFYNGSAWVSC